MKVRIIKANGIKEFEPVFDLEFLKQFTKKFASIPITTTTGNYITTTDGSSITGGLWKDNNTADIMAYSSLNGITINNEAFFKIYSSIS